MRIRSDCAILSTLFTLLFTGLVTAQPPTTLPAAKYQSYALTHQGDPATGKRLFFDEQKLACARCHTVDGTGSKAGPDLFAAGDKFGRDELIQAVLSPSANIAVGYSTTIIQTKSGQVYEGIVKESNADETGLMGADGKLVRIAAASIERQRTTDVSLMPEGLQNGLTLDQFADLVSYLSGLKTPNTAAAAYRGMPAEIPELKPAVRLEPFIDAEHPFEHPTCFLPLPGVPDAFAIVEHESGKIWLIRKTSTGQTKTLFLDTGKYQTGTRGLLGMAFHPAFPRNRRYFVVKHLVNDGHFASHLFEGEASTDLMTDSGRPLQQVLQLDAVTNVHYGGCLQFGPDGYLYIGMGDTGPQGDPEGHAQNMGLPLGKMLRIDVDHPARGSLYSVPADNPFVGKPGIRPEIWASGLREPWRYSFDPLTGDLWVGDVGQDLYEEVDIVRRGENYGWNIFEGFERYSNRYRREGERYVPPVFAYTRKYGNSVTGGYVYRADPRSSFYGAYIFGDYQSRRLFALTQENRQLKKVRIIGRSPQMVVSFGRDNQGELYVVGYEGMIYKLDLDRAKFE